MQSQNPSQVPLPPDAHDANFANQADSDSDATSEMDVDSPTDAQVLGAALSAPPRETVDQDSDAMEEDEFNVVYIGDDPTTSKEVYRDDNSFPTNSQQSQDSEEWRKAQILEDAPDMSTNEDSRDDPDPLEFDGTDNSDTSRSDPSQASSSNQAPSQSSASSSDNGMTSSSSSSTSDKSHDTATLLQKISHLTSPKSLIKIDLPGGSTDSVSNQSSGQDSGSSKDHIPEDSSGKAGIVLDNAGEGE
jgi:hypothetical protein